MCTTGDPVKADRRADFAIAIYTESRAEVRERIAHREQWISRYVFGVVAFLGVSLGIEKLDDFTRIVLCLVMPVVSLIVAINVAAHVAAVENLTNYLRKHLVDVLHETNAWVPFRDWQTTQDRIAGEPAELERNRRRRLTHILSLHLPSIVSLGVAAALILRGYRLRVPSQPDHLTVPALFGIAALFVALAIGTTWRSFDHRVGQTRAKAAEEKQPDPQAPEPQPAAPTA